MWKPTRIQSIIGAVSVVSAASGAGLTFLVLDKKLEAKYRKIADKEIADAKAFYTAVHDKPEDPEEYATKYDKDPKVDAAMAEALKAFSQYKGEALIKDEDPEEPSEEEITRNIFDREDPTFDYEVEVSKRNTVDPHIVTAEEYYQNEPEHEQMSITYFEGDDIVSDGQDNPVEDVENTIGHECLERFGAGSNDPNIVYVRNGRLGMDFEVMLSKGTYAQEVHGIIQHSDDNRPRKFRNYDD